jgi:hypothetical protein
MNEREKQAASQSDSREYNFASISFECTGTPGANCGKCWVDGKDANRKRYVCTCAVLTPAPGATTRVLTEGLKPAPKTDAYVIPRATKLRQQVGGDHYVNMAIQPLEYILANNIPFAEGAAIKYISRWRNKGGIQDLKKAIQTLEVIIEHEEQKQARADQA